MNPNHILIVFNKSIRMGNSSASGLNISADGSDINRSDVKDFGKRFIRLRQRSVELITVPNIGKSALRDKKGRNCVIDEKDVDIIKEVETNNVIWMSPTASEIVIELDPASRPNPQIVSMPNNGPELVQFDSHNSIPLSWTAGLDFKAFPFLMKLHAGVSFRVRDPKWVEFEFLDDISPFEIFYMNRVYQRNGGAVLWQKPQKTKP